MVNIKECLKNFFKSFDMIGETYYFKINRSKSFSSVIGGLTSLAFILYCIYYLAMNVYNFFSKDFNYTVIDEKALDYNYINFSNHSYFVMAFCIRDSFFNVDTYATANLDQKFSMLLDNKEFPIAAEHCSEDYFGQGEFKTLYAQESFQGCSCLNLTKQEDMNGFNVNLTNKHNIRYRDSLNFQFIFNGDNINEFSQHVKKQKSKLFLYFPKFDVDQNNVEDPFHMTVETLSYSLRPFNEIQSDLYFSTLNFTDYSSLVDDNYFYTNSRITLDKTDMIAYYDPSLFEQNEPLINLNMYLSLRTQNFNRKFLKYDDFLDNMVGYLSDVIIMLYVFNVIYNSFAAKVNFAINFFYQNDELSTKLRKELKRKIDIPSNIRYDLNFEDEDKKHQDIEVEIPNYQTKATGFVPQMDEIEHKVHTHDKHNEGNPTSPKLQTLNTMRRLPLKKKNKFKFNFLEYCMYYCCCTKNRRIKTKMNSIENSSALCDYYLDINTYVKKMIEVDMIKILLAEKQPEEIKVLDSFRPYLKSERDMKYYLSIRDLYNKHYHFGEIDEIVQGVKNLKTTNQNFYEALIALS